MWVNLILNYQNWADTLECMRHLLAADAPGDQHWVIVDNASPNGAMAHIEAGLAELLVAYGQNAPALARYAEAEFAAAPLPAGGISLVQAGANGGFAKGNNIALQRLRREDCWVFLVNPDVFVRPDALRHLRACAQNQQEIWGCQIQDMGGHLKYYAGARIRHASGTIVELQSPDAAPDYICGGAMLAHASAFRELGLLPEAYFLYWEDADWCWQARRKGYALRTCAGAIVQDKGGTSIGRGYLAEYYYTRNALFFHRRIGKPLWPIALSSGLFRLPKRLLGGQAARARAIFDGTWDGLRGIDRPVAQVLARR